MNFIKAVKLANKGNFIRRSKWVKEQRIGLVCHGGPLYWIDNGEYTNEFIAQEGSILADDWEIYGEKPKIATARLKTYNFQEAFKALRNGKRIYRLYNMIEIYRDPCDPKLSHTYIYKECPNTAYLKRSYASSMDLFSYNDICAKDWIIMWEIK